MGLWREEVNACKAQRGVIAPRHPRCTLHGCGVQARVAALFEVVVFTASQRIYAERLLDILDPGQALVRHRIYRDSCVVVDGNYLKVGRW